MSNYEATFELSGHGIFNHLVLLSSGFILLHAMVEAVGIAYVITAAECDLGLSISDKGYVTAATFTGIVITAIPWGLLSDTYGRRTVMLPAIFVTVAISFASSMAVNFWNLLILRFLTGCLVSASSATVLVYLGEMHISKNRDFAIASAITFVAIAFVIVPAIAWAIIPGTWKFSLFGLEVKPWRVFMWTWSISGLAGGGILLTLPESPRYILAARGAVFALPVVAHMYAINHKASPDDFPVKHLISSTTVLHKATHVIKDMKEMVRAPLLRCVLISHYCLFIVYFLANGLYIWLPDIINEIMHNPSSSFSICDILVTKYGISETDDNNDSDDVRYGGGPSGGAPECKTKIAALMFPMTIAMEILFLIFFLIITFTIEKFDKKRLYGALMFPFAVALAASAVIPQASMAGFFIALACSCGGAACLLTALAVEVFPTSLRSLAMCTMFMAGQIGAAVGSNIIALCLSGACIVIFFLTAAVIAGSAAALMFSWPDPKKVREEMESRDFTY